MTPIIAGLDEVRAYIMLGILLIGGLFVAHLVSRIVVDRRVTTAMLASPIVDLCLFIVLFSSNPYLEADALLWHSLGVSAAEALDGAVGLDSVPDQDGKDGYVWILGAIYFLGGGAPLLAMLFNSMLRILTVVVTAISAQEIAFASHVHIKVAGEVSLYAALAVAVFPCFAFWSPQVLRESLTVGLIAGALASCILFLNRAQPRILMAAAPLLALLTWIRQDLGVSVSFALGCGVVFTLLGRHNRGSILRVAFVIVSLPMAPLVLNTAVSALGVTPDRIVSGTADLSRSAASGFPGLGFNSSINQVLATTIPRVLAGPFPWEMNFSSVMILALMELLCWITVVLLAIYALPLFRHSSQFAPGRWVLPMIFVTVAALLFGLSMIVGNYGILARFRPIVTVCMVPLAAIGLYRLVHARTLGAVARSGDSSGVRLRESAVSVRGGRPGAGWQGWRS